MKNRILQLLPAALFTVTGLMALVYSKDYWEAASWFSFALAVLVPALPAGTEETKRRLKILSIVFACLGILLLVLRLAGVLPVPVRPIPVI